MGRTLTGRVPQQLGQGLYIQVACGPHYSIFPLLDACWDLTQSEIFCSQCTQRHRPGGTDPGPDKAPKFSIATPRFFEPCFRSFDWPRQTELSDRADFSSENCLVFVGIYLGASFQHLSLRQFQSTSILTLASSERKRLPERYPPRTRLRSLSTTRDDTRRCLPLKCPPRGNISPSSLSTTRLVCWIWPRALFRMESAFSRLEVLPK